MCEYCGCQALAAIDELTREHDLVVRLISQVRTATAASDTPLMAQLARGISAVLGPHTRVEEDGLFPVLEADFPEHIAALRAEHESVEAVLDEACAGTPADPGWPARLTGALAVLRQHILKEQDGVFPAALANLGTSDWEAIEKIRAQAGSMLSGAEPERERPGPNVPYGRGKAGRTMQTDGGGESS